MEADPRLDPEYQAFLAAKKAEADASQPKEYYVHLANGSVLTLPEDDSAISHIEGVEVIARYLVGAWHEEGASDLGRYRPFGRVHAGAEAAHVAPAEQVAYFLTMAAAGLALTCGLITAANEAVFSPLAAHGQPWKGFNWRIIPATGIFAVALYGLEKLSPPFAQGIGYIALVTVLFARPGNAPAPAQNLETILGYGGKKWARFKRRQC
jgi:hypothetical protein